MPNVPDTIPHGIVRYGFRVGAWSLLFDPVLSSELVDREQLCALPNSAPWFIGLANVRGTLTPVFDLENALHEAAAFSQGRKLLVIGVRTRAAALVIDEMPHRLVLDPTAVAPLPLQSDPIAPFVRAAYRLEESSWLDLDYNLLFGELCARGTL